MGVGANRKSIVLNNHFRLTNPMARLLINKQGHSKPCICINTYHLLSATVISYDDWSLSKPYISKTIQFSGTLFLWAGKGFPFINLSCLPSRLLQGTGPDQMAAGSPPPPHTKIRRRSCGEESRSWPQSPGLPWLL